VRLSEPSEVTCTLKGNQLILVVRLFEWCVDSKSRETEASMRRNLALLRSELEQSTVGNYLADHVVLYDKNLDRGPVDIR